MRESEFHRRLLRDYRDMKGYAIKVSDRFTVGTPDLFIHLHGYGSYWIEVKVVTCVKHHERGYPIRLSPMQRATLAEMQNAGMNAGWAVLVRATKERADRLYAGTDHSAARTRPNFLVTEGIGFRFGTKALLQKLTITRGDRTDA